MKIVTITVRRRQNRRRPTVREIAYGVQMLQRAESVLLHAQRDECLPCMLVAAAMRHTALAGIPERLLRNKAWVHRHVEAPAMRMHARGLDEMLRADDA